LRSHTLTGSPDTPTSCQSSPAIPVNLRCISTAAAAFLEMQSRLTSHGVLLTTRRRPTDAPITADHEGLLSPHGVRPRLTGSRDTPKSCQNSPAIPVNLRCISTAAAAAYRSPARRWFGAALVLQTYRSQRPNWFLRVGLSARRSRRPRVAAVSSSHYATNTAEWSSSSTRRCAATSSSTRPLRWSRAATGWRYATRLTLYRTMASSHCLSCGPNDELR
jgi:hypothetical protein